MLALGLLLLRLVIGLTIAGHGAQKLFGWFGGPGMARWTQVVTGLRIRPAQPWAWAAALSEFVGGLLVALGFLTPLGCLAIAGSMLVAIVTVHLSKGFWVAKGGYEFNLAILASVAALALTGPGAYSLDAALKINLPEPLTVIVATILLIVGVGVSLGTRAPRPAEERKARAT
ncbi:MAG TPA: DoxX family protein [Candidatus Dormibacteraeota bacterium]|nr:DoxX family protein [Candidatus Dormibacteraeota bacterium]